MTSPIVVTAATGKTGRRVDARLREQGRPTRPVSRVTELRFDWDDESTWPAVLTGARACYLAYAPDLAVPGSAATVAGVGAEAVRQGVNRIVLLSGRGEPGAPGRASPARRRTLGDRGEMQILRAELLRRHFVEDVRNGRLSLPVDGAGEPFVDADDVAAVAVAALTEPGHEGEDYEVTGRELLTFADAAEAIATGASIP